MQKPSKCASDCTNFNFQIYFTASNIWHTQYARGKCIDCGKDLWMWKNVSHPTWQHWKLSECTHDIKVEETKISYKSHNPNTDYPMHLMIIALVTYKPIQYWVEAPGHCQICSKKFIMTSEYDSVMEQGQKVTQIRGWVVKGDAVPQG